MLAPLLQHALNRFEPEVGNNPEHDAEHDDGHYERTDLEQLRHSLLLRIVDKQVDVAPGLVNGCPTVS